MKTKQKIVFIVGPTATGKSSFAVILAKKIEGEIISCDSVSIYRDINILSSKPPLNLRKQIPHHLIDVISTSCEYDVAKFIKQTECKIKQILKKEKVPIIVGGSGLYVDSLLYGIFKLRKKSISLRNRLMHQALVFGKEYLHNRLRKLDPKTAEKIHPNNLRRTIRALEVCLLSKNKFSSLKQKRNGLIDKYDIRIFGLNIDRDKLYRNIDKRVDRMFKDGAVKEVERLLKRSLSKTASQALGIKEIQRYLEGEHDLRRAKYFLKRNTRHFAKRQLTWFRRNNRIKWLDADLDKRKMLDMVISRI